ncbi:MAG: arylsulfatase [Lentisphaerae bacterium]|nr:arylsulfatase [Lentisphaerota bacterium]MCP4103620.1 arylsulfatase [Lentisphaerota bacterium]
MADLPNIIYIMADDMGYGDLGCYGAEKIPTPNMDSIAANGIKFMDAHSSSAVCTPSRYSVMTGRYCWRTWLKRWVIGGFGAPLIEPERETVASMLKKQGYATFAVGKWHLGLNWRVSKDEYLLKDGGFGTLNEKHLDGFNVDYSQRIDGGPVDLGFDRFWGISGSLDMPPYCFIEDAGTIGIPNQEKSPYSPQQRKGMMTEDWKDDQCDVNFTAKAREYITQHNAEKPDQPFFMYMTPAAPHRPCVPPEFIKGRSQAGARGDAVCLIDWMVGEILKTLRELGIEENTLLMVTSDNGARATCYDGNDYGHKSNGNWRGQKADIWEGGHREPLVMQWPAVIKPGAECEQTVCLADLMATCVEITGFEVSDNLGEDSVSFLSLLKNTAADKVRDTLIHHSGAGMFSIRKNNWKMIAGLGSGGFTDPQWSEPAKGGPEGQLYDLTSDPAETNNLYLAKPDVVEDMMKDLLNTINDDSKLKL